MSVNFINQPEYQCKRNASGLSDLNNVCQVATRYDYLSKVPRPPSYPAESTLHHDTPDMLFGPERLINNDKWVTQSGSVHDRKFYREERDFQPKHPQAPSHDKIRFVRPDCHLKIQGVSEKNMKAYNPFPTQSAETSDAFKAHYPEADFYGPPSIFLTDHFVYMPENRVNVIPAFTYDDMFSVLRKAHPYMTTNRIHHKNFEDELAQHKFLDCLYKSANPKDLDVAIKLRTRPMIDPFEQALVKAGTLPSLDQKRANPGGMRDWAHLKQFFRRPPYYGCLPRVHPPVPHIGMGTSYKEHYDRPFHPNMALNFCRDEQFCFIQPRQSSLAVTRIPAMYESENNIYGSGRNVSHYVDCDHKEPFKMAQKLKDEARENGNTNSSCRLGGGCGF